MNRRFGKHPPKLDYRTLRFKNYVTSAAPPPPSYDVLARVYAQLKVNDPTVLFPMDGNDVYLGFQVQQNCVQEFDAHQPWTPGPLTNDGHAVLAVAYNPNGVTVLTWGNTQQATWAWWDECVDEAYAILPPQAAKPGFAPGFNMAQLQADLAAVAN